jgi:acyl-CoA dehydrogenase
MDFQLTESQQALQEMARKFALEVIRPQAAHFDETAEFPQDIIANAWELGLLNMAIPQEYGGVGLSHLEQLLAYEELAWGCSGITTSIVANDLANLPIILGGSEEQKKRLLTPFTEKLKFSSFCLTEPEAGSDVAGMSTTARREGDAYVLNGAKCFITNGGYADQFTVFATVDKARKHKGITCFVVEGRPEGLTVGKHENKMGQRASNTVALTFDEVRVPVANRIGEEGEGFRIAMETLDNSRPITAILSVGIARAGLEYSLEYSANRKTFGKPIREHQAIQFMLADMATELDAARLLVLRAALLKDQGVRHSQESAMAKLYASEMASRVANKALQVHGGMGYSKEMDVERHVRDARITEIYEGTSEIQRIVISANLLKE